ncbi:hypothetical protein O181_070130 [Austropuccinia psidii MF-1]|uniref:Reverse transcriptase/retrotransposon-derived protein RNase H-like domain-containing protein n=1 Tax=Austropuccinia psidii MF-1 TaxID=1389203 RepID=A0A9Q3EVU8_9BASI|nr:hypothetical protein [Austropuccinia psidii MF-1]
MRFPLGIQTAPCHYKRRMNEIFPKESSEICLIICINDILIYSERWSLHLERLPRVSEVNMEISLKKAHFHFGEIKETGNIASSLSLGINQNELSKILLKPITKNKEKMISFLGFYSRYMQHLKHFAILAKSLYKVCDQQKVSEITQETIREYEKIRKVLTEGPIILIPDWNLPFKLYIDACGDGLREALNRVQIINEKPTEG